ncbi:hypothetical protein ACLB1M_12660 [Escherichia coli]
MILIELLASRQRAPRNADGTVGVSRVIGYVIAFQTGPGGAGDNFTRLRLNIAKAIFSVLFVQRQMDVRPGASRPAPATFDRTLPLVSGASARITSEASMAVSISGRPCAGPSRLV